MSKNICQNKNVILSPGEPNLELMKNVIIFVIPTSFCHILPNINNCRNFSEVKYHSFDMCMGTGSNTQENGTLCTIVHCECTMVL